MASLSRRHSRRPGRMDGGASWISYSDMMAAMLLLFVLILCYSLYQYFLMLETKTAELSQQQSTLAIQETQLVSQQKTLEEREADLRSAQIALVESERELAENKKKVDEQSTTLAAAEILLANQQIKIEDAAALVASQQETLQTQQETLQIQQSKLDTILGVRTRIIEDLGVALTNSNIKAKVDPDTGNILVESTVFFDSGASGIKETGKALLDSFIPVYLSVLLQPDYKDYLGTIIIEGHTDTVGTFLMNLELSQRRALAVVEYCLNMPGLTPEQRETLQHILTSTGRSYSSPIHNADGSVNMEQSRRVEFKFSLKDAEMIAEMNRILSQ